MAGMELWKLVFDKAIASTVVCGVAPPFANSWNTLVIGVINCVASSMLIFFGR